MFSLTKCVGAAVAALVMIAPLGPALSQGQKNLVWMKPAPTSSGKLAAYVRPATRIHRAKATPAKRRELASHKGEAGSQKRQHELARGSESVSDKTAAAAPKSEAALVQPPHHAVIQVTQNDPVVMNMVLNNAENLTKYYRDKGEQVDIELVAYGPGLHMLRSDTSPVKVRLAVLAMDNMTFSACGNTLKAQAKQEGKEITLVPEARIVPSGIARVIELQEQHWTYVRP